MDPLEQVLSELGAAFDSALERLESDAADDLALSLRQDGDLTQTLTDGSGIAVVVEGEARPVTGLAIDHVVVEPGTWLIPLDRAAFIKSVKGVAPDPLASTFLESLRARERHGLSVSCGIGGHEIVGRLTMCGRDHIVLSRSHDEVVIPISAICWLRFYPEDLAGAP